MLYYSTEARMSAATKITDLMEKISEISGDQLSYTDAKQTVRFLAMLKDEIFKEDKRAKENK